MICASFSFLGAISICSLQSRAELEYGPIPFLHNLCLDWLAKARRKELIFINIVANSRGGRWEESRKINLNFLAAGIQDIAFFLANDVQAKKNTERKKTSMEDLDPWTH